MKAYLLQTITQLDEHNNVVYTSTLTLPGLSKEEYLELLQRVGNNGEVEFDITTLRLWTQ